MKTWIALCLSALSLAPLSLHAQATAPAPASAPTSVPLAASVLDPMSPVGLWKTVDDKTGRVRSIVRIEAKGQELQGFIHQRLDPDAKPDAVCTPCTDDRKNKPLQDLNIIRGLKANPKEAGVWENGTVLDPENGSEYRLKIKVIEGGKKLELRGYIGTPLLGRTQVWLRHQP